SELTSADNLLGTPAYMSPEQVAGPQVDSRSDLFSLGCVLYAMVMGRSPFQGSHALDVARRVTDLVPPPLHEQCAQIPLFLSDTVCRLLEKQPDRRYQTAADVHQLLLGHLAKLHQGSSAEAIAAPSSAAPRKRRFRHWRTVVAAATLLVALGAALGP